MINDYTLINGACCFVSMYFLCDFKVLNNDVKPS